MHILWERHVGFAQKKRARLAPVALPNGVATAHLLQNLMQAPDGMTAIELSDGRRVFAPIGSDPEVVRTNVESGKIAPR
ncbi:hypothetical protein A1351_22155 [Methylosinus sp. R-45379]|nr:hypothetical protein A1351_22155 [Methylosinus sp. R-45379]